MLFRQLADLGQIQLALLAPALLSRGHSRPKLLVQVVAVLANLFCLVAAGQLSQCVLSNLQLACSCIASLHYIMVRHGLHAPA